VCALYSIKYDSITIMIVFNKWIRRDLRRWSKIPCGLPTISKTLMSTSIKTLWPADTVTFPEVRQIGAYSIGLRILLGKLGCPKNKKKVLKK